MFFLLAEWNFQRQAVGVARLAATFVRVLQVSAAFWRNSVSPLISNLLEQRPLSL